MQVLNTAPPPPPHEELATHPGVYPVPTQLRQAPAASLCSRVVKKERKRGCKQHSEAAPQLILSMMVRCLCWGSFSVYLSSLQALPAHLKGISILFLHTSHVGKGNNAQTHHFNPALCTWSQLLLVQQRHQILPRAHTASVVRALQGRQHRHMSKNENLMRRFIFLSLISERATNFLCRFIANTMKYIF